MVRFEKNDWSINHDTKTHEVSDKQLEEDAATEILFIENYIDKYFEQEIKKE
ncbi:hypothetical protein ACFSTH_14030 [Paenibacillus yanchengensis]